MANKRQKLLDKARNNPEGFSFAEFETLLSLSGWKFRQGGNHPVWKAPAGELVPIQPRKDGKAKAYQVKQALKIMESRDV